jgi:VWFA-related protein
MQDVADRSGGRFYHADTLGNLSRAFSQIAEELRHQYAISYYPTNAKMDGTYRQIKVRLTPNTGNSSLIVRAKEGYRAASDAPDADENNRRKRPTFKRRDSARGTVSRKE